MADGVGRRRAAIAAIVLLLSGCAMLHRRALARMTAALVRDRDAAERCADRVACARADMALAAAVTKAERAGVQNHELVSALSTLAMRRQATRKPADANALYDRAASLLAGLLATEERTLGPDHPRTVATLEDLALLQIERGRNADALPLLERVVANTERRRGRTSEAFDERLDLLATTYAHERRDAEAERTYRRLVAVREEALGPSHAKVGAALDGVAESCLRQGRTAEAEALYLRALAIEEHALRADTPVVVVEYLVVAPGGTWERAHGWPMEPVRALEGLGSMYREQNREPETRALCESALASREQRLGPDHPFVGTVLERLAQVNERLGAYRQADAEYRRLLVIKEKRLGTDDPQLADALRHHATVLWKLGRDAEAQTVDGRAASLEHRAVIEPRGPGSPPPEPARFYRQPAPID